MPEIAVPKVLGQTQNKFKVSVPKHRLVTKEDQWETPLRMENMPIAIYDEKGELKEVITRTGRPVNPGMGLWAFKYRGEWYTTIIDSLFKCGSYQIGKQRPMKRGGSYA